MEQEKQVYNITFVALTPVEQTGKVAWEGTREDALSAMSNYLVGLYGPGKFKVTQFDPTDDSSGDILELPASPVNSRQHH